MIQIMIDNKGNLIYLPISKKPIKIKIIAESRMGRSSMALNFGKSLVCPGSKSKLGLGMEKKK